MASRLKLHEELEALLGNKNVYFQPPESVRLIYPCIIYKLTNIRSISADDLLYKYDKQYELMLIERDPDNSHVEDLLKHFKMIRFGRSYQVDNLNHYTYELYY